MNFKFSIRFFAICVLGASVIPLSAAPVAEYEIGKWADFCQGAVSHTFDDNTAHQTDSGQALFDAKGFHMTLFVITGQVTDWAKYKAAFAKGHEIASHSVTHPGTMPDAESAPSQAAIKKSVPGEMCASIAYPNCNIPTPTTTSLKKCYIAGRVCDGQVGPKTPVDFWRVSCKMAGTGGSNTYSGMFMLQ